MWNAEFGMRSANDPSCSQALLGNTRHPSSAWRIRALRDIAGVVIALMSASDIFPAEPTGHAPYDPNKRPPLFVVGTEAYAGKIRSFSITAEHARLLAERAARGKIGEEFGPVGRHLVIVGDDYLFSSDWHKTYMFLEGYFVNGKTGEVQARHTFWRVRFRDYPELTARLKEHLEAN